MKYRIVHRTRYAYAEPVLLCHNEARLQPRTTACQRCEFSEVAIEPFAAQRAQREDIFGNRVLYFAGQNPHEELVVTATSIVDVFTASTALAPRPTLSWEESVARIRVDRDEAARDARQFALDSPFAAVSSEVAEWAQPWFGPGRPLLDAVAAMSQHIHDDFTFDASSTTVATPPSEVLAQRGGVCQDFAHLAIACLRSKGIPTRYVSGYLETIPPPGQPRVRGADVSHAWFAVFVPDLGWVDFDPTTNLTPPERHVTTAWGRDYGDVTPLKGVIFGGGAHVPEVAVDMVRLNVEAQSAQAYE
ncbi:MAG TPA: transglutaminase family protein [Candidatus Binatia bacterium]|nr:transglutaminase family protein [Candidatus Binatia bacterium]